MSISKIKKQTVVDQVMDQFKDLISTGKYKPGDKIPTEIELAEQFGIGRSSIRQVVKIFNYLGVLESKPSIGTFVQERAHISTESLTWSLLLGNDEIEEMIDLRASIESWSVLELTRRTKNKEPKALELIDALENIIKEMKKSASNNNKESLIALDFDFHNTIIHFVENELFNSLYKTLKSFLFDEIKRTQMKYANLKLIPQEHANLIDAIKSGEQATALFSYQEHIENIKYKLKNKSKIS